MVLKSQQFKFVKYIFTIEFSRIPYQFEFKYSKMKKKGILNCQLDRLYAQYI